MSEKRKIYFTRKDYEILDQILQESSNSAPMEFLEQELSRGEVVTDELLPDNVVSLYSRARVLDQSTSKERELTIIPPGEATAEEGQISVTAPLGAAVIGLSEGQEIDWPMPSGNNRRFKVMKVLYQPEAEQKLRRAG